MNSNSSTADFDLVQTQSQRRNLYERAGLSRIQGKLGHTITLFYYLHKITQGVTHMCSDHIKQKI